jgi:hypothetical protein
MLLVLFIAFAITAIVVAVVARLDMTKVGFRQLEKGEPDLVLGRIVIVLSVALVLANIRYGRADAPRSATIMLNSYAAAGFWWGLAQVVGARKWARRQKKVPKLRRDEIATK